jgi:hypothetical protein
MHSPKASDKLDVENDTMKKPNRENVGLRIPADQAVWHTLPGEE